MGTFAAGQIVLVRFPFSDLTASKVRPAVVLADAGRNDWVLAQITSQPYGDAAAISLGKGDFKIGGLQLASYIRSGKLFTAHASLIVGQVGELGAPKLLEVRNAIVQMIQKG
jgi:mRNA interferase MazF